MDYFFEGEYANIYKPVLKSILLNLQYNAPLSLKLSQDVLQLHIS